MNTQSALSLQEQMGGGAAAPASDDAPGDFGTEEFCAGTEGQVSSACQAARVILGPASCFVTQTTPGRSRSSASSVSSSFSSATSSVGGAGEPLSGRHSGPDDEEAAATTPPAFHASLLTAAPTPANSSASGAAFLAAAAAAAYGGSGASFGESVGCPTTNATCCWPGGSAMAMGGASVAQHLQQQSMRPPSAASGDVICGLLDMHDLAAGGNRSYQCKLCLSVSTLRTTRGHLGSASPSCVQMFESKSELQVHTQGHMREAKPYKCSHCPKNFANSSYLSQHMRIHLGWYRISFSCVFIYKIIAGIKPFGPCQYCGRKVNNQMTFEIHHVGQNDKMKRKKAMYLLKIILFLNWEMIPGL